MEINFSVIKMEEMFLVFFLGKLLILFNLCLMIGIYIGVFIEVWEKFVEVFNFFLEVFLFNN